MIGKALLLSVAVAASAIVPVATNAAPAVNAANAINANDDEFSSCLEASKCIVVRSGYSTLMDLMRLNRSALLIPTPGQTETHSITVKTV